MSTPKPAFADCKVCKAHGTVPTNELTAAVCAPSCAAGWLFRSSCGKCGETTYHCTSCGTHSVRWKWVKSHYNQFHAAEKSHPQQNEDNGQEGRWDEPTNDMGAADFFDDDTHMDGDVLCVEQNVSQEGTAEDTENVRMETNCWLKQRLEQSNGPRFTADTLESIRGDEGNFHSESKSPEYYFFERHDPGKGAKYLTAKAFGLSPDDITEDEAMFSLRITKFLGELSTAQRRSFAEFMFLAANSRDEQLSIFQKTRLPISVEDFNDLYLSGKNSVSTNLPHPVIRKTPDGSHAHVSLTEVVAHMLASATEVDEFYFESDLYAQGLDSPAFEGQEPATISTSRAGYTLFIQLRKEDEGKFVLCLWVKWWRDDFDPNNTKASRNQCHLTTATICAPRTEKKGRNTFFMSISSKGDDHEGIEKTFAEELEHLREGKMFFHGGLGELILVKAGQVSVCVDRPERASMFQVGDHNGSYSMMWGHATQVDAQCNDNHLPDCICCRRDRINALLNQSTSCVWSSNVSPAASYCRGLTVGNGGTSTSNAQVSTSDAPASNARMGSSDSLVSTSDALTGDCDEHQ